MIQSLKDICNIQFGLYEKPLSAGNVYYLQGTSIFQDQNPKSITTFLSLQDISPNHLLKEGDILFAAKGVRNIAVKFTNTLAPAVASSLFFVIKPDTHKVISDYLEIFLNDAKTQNVLRSLTGTTTVPHISKKDLSEISIPLPSIEEQKKIVSLMKHWEEEKKLTQQLIDKKEQFYSTMFNDLIQNKTIKK